MNYDTVGFSVFIFLVGFFLFIGYQCGKVKGERIAYERAIADGVGEYYIVEKETGKTGFRWKK